VAPDPSKLHWAQAKQLFKAPREITGALIAYVRSDGFNRSVGYLKPFRGDCQSPIPDISPYTYPQTGLEQAARLTARHWQLKFSTHAVNIPFDYSGRAVNQVLNLLDAPVDFRS